MTSKILLASFVGSILNICVARATEDINHEDTQHNTRQTHHVVPEMHVIIEEPLPSKPCKKINTSYLVNTIPFAITGIGACIHCTTLVVKLINSETDPYLPALLIGDIFWMSSSVSGIFINLFRSLRNK